MNLAFNPKDANTFLSACLDRTIKMWSLGSSTPNFSIEAHEIEAYDKGVNYVDFYPVPINFIPIMSPSLSFIPIYLSSLAAAKMEQSRFGTAALIVSKTRSATP
jgi:WD40 repeat protein